MAKEEKALTDKQRIKNLESLVIKLCHRKGCDDLPREYGLDQYSVTANDMTKYKKA